MKYFVIAGEASGDMHAANMLLELKTLDTNGEFIGWGGDQMQAAGVKIQKHIRELAFMGFVEVVANLRTILRNFSICKKQLLEFQPDVVVLVDYPGFNLRMAKWAKQQGFRVMYYISPTIWAWKEKRVLTIKKYVDHMACILPFEPQWYHKWGYQADYVGHPTVEVVAKEMQKSPTLDLKNCIALLPGSRVQEIKKMLPIMLAAIDPNNSSPVVIAQAPNLDTSVYKPYIGQHKVQLHQFKTYEILKQAQYALVTSGTATLETALFKVPQLVCYIANPISYAIAKRLVKVKYISLVNLILDREVVTELIQDDLTVERLRTEIDSLLHDIQRQQRLQLDYDELENVLKEGKASKRTAEMTYSLALHQ